VANSSQATRDDLEPLARARFGKLSEAELKLLRAAPHGNTAVCGPNQNDDDPASDPAQSDSWSSDREIHAELIRWLCVDAEAAKKVDPKGLRVYAAKVTGKLDLSFASVPFPLGLFRCRLTEDADLTSVQVPALNLAGSRTRSIKADGARVTGDVFLRKKFTAEGAVRLLGAQIGGDLDCSGGIFTNPGGDALSAERARVTGNVFLRDKFTAEGEVRLPGAQIDGDLDCSGGTFTNPAPPKSAEGTALTSDAAKVVGSGVTLNADGANVTGDVILRDKFTAEGEVRLIGAQIGGALGCSGGTFRNPGGDALSADRTRVAGSVFLNDKFTAEGAVRLLGAQIDGDLDCRGGTFKNPRTPENPDAKTLFADRARVTGSVFLMDKFTAEGEVRLLGAQIGGDLGCSGGAFSALNAETAVIKGNFFWRDVQNPAGARLNLTNASAGAIAHYPTSWPSKGKLFLDGFTYDRISEGPRDAKTLLEWLERLDEFALQPYQQLAKVLRETGDTRGARRVLFEMERRRREEERKKIQGLLVLPQRWFASVWSCVLRWTIGYGQMPGRAFGWLAALWLLGFIFSGLGYLGGAMAPSQKDAYEIFQQQGQPPAYYPRFCAPVYSLDHSFPFVNLGEKDSWAPDPAGLGRVPKSHSGCLEPASGRYILLSQALRLDSPTFLRVWFWVQIMLGWVLATLFVAGLTGIVRSG